MEVWGSLQDVAIDQGFGEWVTVVEESALGKEDEDLVNAVKAIIIQHLAEKVPSEDRLSETQGSPEQDIRIKAIKSSKRDVAERTGHKLPLDSKETQTIIKRESQRHKIKPTLQSILIEIIN